MLGQVVANDITIVLEDDGSIQCPSPQLKSTTEDFLQSYLLENSLSSPSQGTPGALFLNQLAEHLKQLGLDAKVELPEQGEAPEGTIF